MQRNAKNYTQSACVWIVLLLIVVPARVNHLYAQVSTAMIQGTVMDASGAVIADAGVQVKNAGTGITQSTTTDAAGRFSLSNLGVGEYELQASKTGFSTMVRKGITLNVGAQRVVDFTLPVGQEMQTVTVEGQVSQVETTNAAVGSLITTQQMAQLPLNGRNFEQLIFLAPGVSLINTMSPNARQGRAPVPSAAGARPEGYVILQDDESLNNFFNRGIGTITGTSLGMEAIAEFQTLTNTYSAQFGGNGAVVNAVSKSGTNRFHGSAYAFLRNSALDARGFFDPTIIPFRRFQPGASIGGPLKKNKMFFFVNYEGVWQLLAQTRIATLPNATSRTPSFARATNPATYDAIVNTLAIYPLPTFNFKPIAGTSLGTGQFAEVANQVAQEHYFLGRFDYNLSEKDSFFARYFFDKQHVIDPFAGGGVNGNQFLPYWPERDEGFNTFATIEWRRVISPTLLNTARISFSRPNTADYAVNSFPALQFFPGSGRPDANVSITGLSTLGQSYFVPAVDIQNKFTEADDIAWTKGAHTLHMGASILRLDSNVFYPFRSSSVWTFQSLANFLAGTALSVVGTPVGPQYYTNRDYREIDFTPYVQDDWKVTPRLTLNLGLRWDFTTNPVARYNTLYAVSNYAGTSLATSLTNVPNVTKNNTSWKNLDPRFGFAYDIFGDHKTALRGGFAINHSPIFPAQYNPMFTAIQPWNSYNATNPTYPIPNFTGAASSTAISPGWDWFINKAPYLIQYNLNLQREIFASTILTVGYVGSHGVDLITQQEQNPPTPTYVNGVPSFATLVGGRIVGNPRLNPNLGYLQMSVGGTSSRYNSAQVTLERRFSRNVQAQVNYTFSRCIDDGGSPIGSINGGNTPSNYQNPFNRSADKGLCYFNSTHNFRANGMVTLPFHGNRIVEGWQLSPIVTWNTGLPLTVGDGVDMAGFGYVPPGAPRPNYVAGCNVDVRTVNEWFNPACFTVAAPGTFGNLGRNTIIGPGLANVDFAVIKETRIRESLRVQFRAEFFNIFNHAQFGQPSTSLFTAGATGACTATGAGCVNPNTSAGQITSLSAAARQIQFGLKVVF